MSSSQESSLALDRREMATEELNRGHGFTVQLLNLIRHYYRAEPQSGMAEGLLSEVQRSIIVALAILDPGRRKEAVAWAGGEFAAALRGGGGGRKRSHNMNRVNKKRSFKNSAVSTTATPYDDGHQWRKYGAKVIRGHSFPKEYYRCTYKEDQGCLAVKQVQKLRDGVQPMYLLTSINKHTCKPSPIPPPRIIVDSTSQMQQQQQYSSHLYNHNPAKSEQRSPFSRPGILNVGIDASYMVDASDLVHARTPTNNPSPVDGEMLGFQHSDSCLSDLDFLWEELASNGIQFDAGGSNF